MFFTVDLYSEWDVLYCETRAPIIFFPGNHSHSMISLAVTGRAPLPGIIKMFCSCYWKSWEMQNRRTWRGEKGVRKSIEEVAGKWSSRQSELSTWSGEEKDGPQAVSVMQLEIEAKPKFQVLWKIISENYLSKGSVEYRVKRPNTTWSVFFSPAPTITLWVFPNFFSWYLSLLV